ncbi:hypothetical protein IEQ34_011341 [Dendrobium chrysotoxum]|uniref:Uncharacterized protein n=1 Tax=Dendrobium chrysotoxum TaxID=161865 RepID=A0AAV7GYF2_DENCH|nr:hypothetical protein IEQ34_011341 [Dendrobium chrysotoxum]
MVSLLARSGYKPRTSTTNKVVAIGLVGCYLWIKKRGSQRSGYCEFSEPVDSGTAERSQKAGTVEISENWEENSSFAAIFQKRFRRNSCSKRRNWLKQKEEVVGSGSRHSGGEVQHIGEEFWHSSFTEHHSSPVVYYWLLLQEKERERWKKTNLQAFIFYVNKFCKQEHSLGTVQEEFAEILIARGQHSAECTIRVFGTRKIRHSADQFGTPATTSATTGNHLWPSSTTTFDHHRRPPPSPPPTTTSGHRRPPPLTATVGHHLRHHWQPPLATVYCYLPTNPNILRKKKPFLGVVFLSKTDALKLFRGASTSRCRLVPFNTPRYRAVPSIDTKYRYRAVPSIGTEQYRALIPSMVSSIDTEYWYRAVPSTGTERYEFWYRATRVPVLSLR